MSRGRVVTVHCSTGGCTRRSYVEVFTKKEEIEVRARPWWCIPHDRHDDISTSEDERDPVYREIEWNRLYDEAMQSRDWQTCEILIGERENSDWWVPPR